MQDIFTCKCLMISLRSTSCLITSCTARIQAVYEGTHGSSRWVSYTYLSSIWLMNYEQWCNKTCSGWNIGRNVTCGLRPSWGAQVNPSRADCISLTWAVAQGQNAMLFLTLPRWYTSSNSIKIFRGTIQWAHSLTCCRPLLVASCAGRYKGIAPRGASGLLRYWLLHQDELVDVMNFFSLISSYPAFYSISIIPQSECIVLNTFFGLYVMQWMGWQ